MGVDLVLNKYVSQNLESLPKIGWVGVRTCKFGRDFGQLEISIASICGADQRYQDVAGNCIQEQLNKAYRVMYVSIHDGAVLSTVIWELGH